MTELGVLRTASFEREGSLPWCGCELVDGEALMDILRAADAVEAGGGEDERVALTFGPLAEAGVDVAAEFDEGDVRAQREDHGLATR